jgi:hypothetical protein
MEQSFALFIYVNDRTKFCILTIVTNIFISTICEFAFIAIYFIRAW